jgi:hypothetical protein
MPHLSALKIVQQCYVVRDLEAACARLHDLYGIGPFVGGVEAVLDNHVYRGAPAPAIRLKGVFVQSGDLNIELVELLSDTPSAFHDMFPDGAEGLHHVAMFSDDYDATRAHFIACGLPVISEFETAFGAKICYIDARDTWGHMIELYPENTIIRAMYDQTRQAPIGWDGKDLIIPWA